MSLNGSEIGSEPSSINEDSDVGSKYSTINTLGTSVTRVEIP